MKDVRTLSARNAAWKTLNQCDIARHDTADILNRMLGRTDRPGQATDIVYGVIRHRGTLDHILTKCARLDPTRVKRPLWNLLRIGVYELVYCPETADYAVINEAVELAAAKSSKKVGGFVNAVLRNVQRSIQDRQGPYDPNNMRRIIPQTPQTGCRFKVNLLPDPDKEMPQYFNNAFSLPQALINEWLATFGRKQTHEICLACNRHPSVIAQPNTCQITTADLVNRLEEEAIVNKCINNSIRIHSTGKMNTSRAYLDGLFYIQDPTASQAITMLNPQPGWTVFDMCAAPGGKCLSLAMSMQDRGVIIASDIDSKRLSRVRENAKRMRLQSIEIVLHHHLEQFIRKQKRLDAIVLDVPCSNTGVLARRVEARWRWKPEAVENLCQIQQELLCKAADFARPKTKLLYSTCSIQPRENQQQVQAFLTTHKQFRRLNEKLTLPSVQTENTCDHDGGYAAVLEMN